MDGDGTFCKEDKRACDVRLAIQSKGNVGIGTYWPKTKLAVNGTITAKEINEISNK